MFLFRLKRELQLRKNCTPIKNKTNQGF